METDINMELARLGKKLQDIMAAGAPVPKVVLDQEQVRKAKEQRFGLSARIIGGNKVKQVKVIDQPSLQANADYNTGTRLLRLNEAYPLKIQDEVEELIFDRGKMYHELGHALYTAHKTNREALAKKSKSPDTFMTVSGLLEDGRIERKMIESHRGTQPFFDALLKASTDPKSMDVLNGLALRVRKGFWRNAEESEFWAPFEKQIDKAVKANHTNGVLQVAYDIVEAMEIPPTQPPPPTQPTEPDPKGEEKEKEKGEGEGEGKEKPEGGEGKPEDGEGKPEDSESNSDESGTGSGTGKSPREQVEQIVKDAIQQLRSEAQAEWDGIVEQVTSDPVQEMATPEEESEKDQLVPLFRNVLTEAARSKEYGSREGILNTLGLHNILTSKRVFKTKVEGKGKPHVALLLDASSSMGGMMRAANKSARIINGALREAGIPTTVIAFGVADGNHVEQMSTIPREGIPATGGTPTGDALAAANKWFEDQSATRPLAIIITDGGPNDINYLIRERQKTNDMNGYVIGVQLESERTREYNKKFYPKFISERENMYNTHSSTESASNLPDLLEPMITDYINS